MFAAHRCVTNLHSHSVCSYAQRASHPELLHVHISFFSTLFGGVDGSNSEQLATSFDFKAGPIYLFGITSISRYTFILYEEFTPPKGFVVCWQSPELNEKNEKQIIECVGKESLGVVCSHDGRACKELKVICSCNRFYPHYTLHAHAHMPEFNFLFLSKGVHSSSMFYTQLA